MEMIISCSLLLLAPQIQRGGPKPAESHATAADSLTMTNLQLIERQIRVITRMNRWHQWRPEISIVYRVNTTDVRELLLNVSQLEVMLSDEEDKCVQMKHSAYLNLRGSVAGWLRRWTCNQQVAGSTPGRRIARQRPWASRSHSNMYVPNGSEDKIWVV